MKQFVHAILSAAALATLAGCASNQEETLFAIDDPVRDEITKKVDERIQFFKQHTVDPTESDYNSEYAKEFFNSTPAVAQQKKFTSLSYTMESLDGKQKVSYTFALGRRMKFVVKDNNNKVLYAQILNGDKAYNSNDGVLYKEITLDEHVNELRLTYDMAMAFARNAKSVTLAEINMEGVKEPLIVKVDDQRCWMFHVNLGDENYDALVSVFVTADENRHQVANKIKPGKGLAKDPLTVICSRFFVKDGVVFPGFITTDSKDAPQMTLKDLVVNKTVSDLEFEPDTLN